MAEPRTRRGLPAAVGAGTVALIGLVILDSLAGDRDLAFAAILGIGLLGLAALAYARRGAALPPTGGAEPGDVQDGVAEEGYHHVAD